MVTILLPIFSYHKLAQSLLTMGLGRVVTPPERIDVFFNNLDSYLSNYRDSLRQAQQAQKLSLQQKEQLIADIKSIDSEAKKQIKTSDIYIQQTDDIVRRK